VNSLPVVSLALLAAVIFDATSGAGQKLRSTLAIFGRKAVATNLAVGGVIHRANFSLEEMHKAWRSVNIL
jgi:hypothetical protein